MTRNTSISKVAFWEWRLMPADRKDSEVRTYYLSPEELEKYKKGEKKMENKIITENKSEIKSEKLTLTEIIKRDLGQKTLEQIAEEQNMNIKVVRMVAARLGLSEKSKNEVVKNLVIKDFCFKVVGVFTYSSVENKIIIRQDKRKNISLYVDNVDKFIEELKFIAEKIKKLQGVLR